MDDRILEAFEFGNIQECINIKLVLDKNNISWEEFLEWVKDMSGRVLPSRKVPFPPDFILRRRCPNCKSSWLRLEEVNKHPRLMVGGDLKCQWYCRVCDWDEFSAKDIVDEARPYVEELKIVYVPVTPKQERASRRIAAQKKTPVGVEETKW